MSYDEGQTVTQYQSNTKSTLSILYNAAEKKSIEKLKEQYKKIIKYKSEGSCMMITNDLLPILKFLINKKTNEL